MKQITKPDLIPQCFCGIDYYDLCEALINCQDCQHRVNYPSTVSVNLLREVLKDIDKYYAHWQKIIKEDKPLDDEDKGKLLVIDHIRRCLKESFVGVF